MTYVLSGARLIRFNGRPGCNSALKTGEKRNAFSGVVLGGLWGPKSVRNPPKRGPKWSPKQVETEIKNDLNKKVEI